jgi:glutamate-1-semialdehyde 2,1-aminomutase
MDLVAPAGPVYQAGTLSANPVAMVAGLTTLKKLRKLNPYHELESEVERSSRALEGMAKELGIALQVQRFASLFWCIFGEIQTQDGMVRSPSMIPAVHKEVYSQVFHGLLEKGIYMAPSAFEVSFLSLAHRREHQDYVLDSMREVLRECRRG